MRTPLESVTVEDMLTGTWLDSEVTGVPWRIVTSARTNHGGGCVLFVLFPWRPYMSQLFSSASSTLLYTGEYHRLEHLIDSAAKTHSRDRCSPPLRRESDVLSLMSFRCTSIRTVDRIRKRWKHRGGCLYVSFPDVVYFPLNFSRLDRLTICLARGELVT